MKVFQRLFYPTMLIVITFSQTTSGYGQMSCNPIANSVVSNPGFEVYDTTIQAPRSLDYVCGWSALTSNILHEPSVYFMPDLVVRILQTTAPMSFYQNIHVWKGCKYIDGHIEISTCTPAAINDIYLVLTNEEGEAIPSTGQIIYHITDSVAFQYNVNKTFNFTFTANGLYKRLVVYSPSSTLLREIEIHKVDFKLSSNGHYNAGEDQTICLNGTARLGGDSTDLYGPTVLGITPVKTPWTSRPLSTFDDQALNPIVSPPITTTYFLHSQGNVIEDSVTITVNPCLCEWPTQITSLNGLSPIEVGTTSNYVYSLYHFAGSQIQTSFCNYPVYTNPSTGGKLLLAVHRKDGTLKTIRSFNITELYPGMEPVVSVSGDDVVVSICYKGTIFDFDNNTSISSSSSGKFATNVLCFNSEGVLNWQQNMTSVNGNIYGCDLAVGSSSIYIMGNKPYGRIGNFTTNQGTFIAYLNKATGTVSGAATIGSSYSWPSITTMNFNGNEALLSNQCGSFKVFYSGALQASFNNLYTSQSSTSKDRILYNGNGKIWVLDEPGNLYEFVIGTRLPISITAMPGTWPFSIGSSSFVDVDCQADTLYFSTNLRKNDDKFYFLSTYDANTLQKYNEAQTNGETYLALDKTEEMIYSVEYFSPTADIKSFDLNLVAEGCNKLYVDAGNDKTICVQDTIAIGGNPTFHGGSGSYTFNWTSTPPSTIFQIANPEVSPDEETNYKISVIDNQNINNCKSDVLNIDIYEQCCFWPKYIYASEGYSSIAVNRSSIIKRTNDIIMAIPYRFCVKKNGKNTSYDSFIFDDGDTIGYGYTTNLGNIICRFDYEGRYLAKKIYEKNLMGIFDYSNGLLLAEHLNSNQINQIRQLKITKLSNELNIANEKTFSNTMIPLPFQIDDMNDWASPNQGSILLDSTLYVLSNIFGDSIDNIPISNPSLSLIAINANTFNTLSIRPIIYGVENNFSITSKSHLFYSSIDSSIWIRAKLNNYFKLIKFYPYNQTWETIIYDSINSIIQDNPLCFSPEILPVSSNELITYKQCQNLGANLCKLSVSHNTPNYNIEWINTVDTIFGSSSHFFSTDTSVIISSSGIIYCDKSIKSTPVSEFSFTNGGKIRTLLTHSSNSFVLHDNSAYLCLSQWDSLSWDNISINVANIIDSTFNCSVFQNDIIMQNPNEGLDINKKCRFSIYPSPFNNKLTILDNDNSEKIKIKLYSIKGILLVETNNTTIHTSELASGAYIITIVSEETSKILLRKLVIKI